MRLVKGKSQPDRKGRGKVGLYLDLELGRRWSESWRGSGLVG